MYPISFDNPNQRKGQPKAANRNIAGDDLTSSKTDADSFNRAVAGAEEIPENAQKPISENTPDYAGPSSLLVVECRRDDKWRVDLCTDLSELDSAMDMARALRSAADVDEVCLTLEVSGANGRESRREVLRFNSEISEPQVVSQAIPLVVSPTTAIGTVPVAEQPADGMAVLSASMKIPDYDMDDIDFSEFAMPERPTVLSETPIRADVDRAQFEFEEPIDIGTLSGTLSGEREPDREAARSLLSSIYGDLPEPVEDDSIRVKIPHTRTRQDHADWLYRTQSSAELLQAQRLRLEAEDGLDDGAVEKFEVPLFAKQDGLAGKLLVFAGTIALLVLGGALAELLAVDITTTANAGVGAFDTFSSVSGTLLR